MKFNHAINEATEIRKKNPILANLMLCKIIFSFPERYKDINSYINELLTNNLLLESDISNLKSECKRYLKEFRSLDYVNCDAFEKLGHILSIDLSADVFQDNLNILQSYPFYFSSEPTSYDYLSISPVLFDEDYICFVKDNQIVLLEENLDKVESKSEDVHFVANYPFVNNMVQLNEFCENKILLNNQRNPVYFYFSDKSFLEVLLFNPKFGMMIKDTGIVIIYGEDALDKLFSDSQSIFPTVQINCNQHLSEKLERHKSLRTSQVYRISDEILKYYSNNKSLINNNVKNKRTKILFLTCLFTTVLQYRTRDCLEACRAMGYEARLLMEKSPISSLNFDILKVINEFKPDVTFTLDHFRDLYLPTVPYHVTWIQDLLANLLSPEQIGKLSHYDLVLNQFVNDNQIVELYKGKNLIDAPIPVNENIYKRMHISEDEQKKYECDICLVCHAADYKETISYNFPYVKNELFDMADEYYQMALESNFLYREEEVYDFLYSRIEAKEVVPIIVSKFFPSITNSIYRHVLVEWLLEAGITNIKLWGNDWHRTKFKDYAMGTAENGEALSKILQCSKIVLASNNKITMTGRVTETLLSGGFYLSNYIPEPHDSASILKIFKEDEDIVVFRNKLELIEKVRFFLSHPGERAKMIDKGYEKVLNELTIQKTMEKTIQKLSDMAEENIITGR